jgi:hypothetical protein
VSLTVIAGCGQSNEKSKNADGPAKTAEAKPEPPAVPAKAPKRVDTNTTLDPQRLVGQWLRPDGGYVIKITHVARDGKVEASYHNPGPIRVESARASTDTGKLLLRVKLNDRGYPGCIYELEYDRANDVLTGTYFQAAMQQTYRILFQRLQ